MIIPTKSLPFLAPLSPLFPCEEGARDDRVLDGTIFIILFPYGGMEIDHVKLVLRSSWEIFMCGNSILYFVSSNFSRTCRISQNSYLISILDWVFQQLKESLTTERGFQIDADVTVSATIQIQFTRLDYQCENHPE